MKKTLFTLTTLLVSLTALASYDCIQTMVGQTNHTDALIWVHYEGNNKLTVKTTSQKDIEAKITQPIGYVSSAIIPNLKPNTTYTIDINSDSLKSTATFKTKPDFIDRTPPPNFSFIAIGDNYINDKDFDPPFRTPGGEYEIYNTAKDVNANFALWIGSLNKLRNADLSSKSAIFNRFLNIKNLAEAQNLFASQPNYGVMGKDILSDSTDASAKAYKQAFDLSWLNPKTLDENGNYYSFSYSDAQFFVLDTFSYSSNLDYKTDWPTLLGEKQMKWLMNSLQNSTATFKFIVIAKPFANPVESNKYFSVATKERKAITDFLFDKKIKGVVILSKREGYAEITKMIRASTYPLMEISAGPMTARPDKEVKEMNYFRVPSSAQTKRTFTKIDVSGDEGNRIATISFIESTGKTLFTQIIKESDLK